MIRFFRKLFKRGDFMTRADKAYYKYRAKTFFWSAFCLIIISWVGTNLVLCALTTNVKSGGDIIFEPTKPITLPIGQELRKKIAEGAAYTSDIYYCKSITFDYYSSGKKYEKDGVNLIEGLDAETVISNQNGSVELYRDADTNIYILSNCQMFANPDFSFSFCKIGGGCKIMLNNYDSSNVTNMSNMFAYHYYQGVGSGYYVSSKPIGMLNTSNVTNMSYMFANNNSSEADLNELGAASWNTSKVTNMEGMFDKSSYAQNFDFSKWNVSSVRNMTNMFRSSSGVTKLDLSTWKLTNCTTEGMFQALTTLTSLNLNKTAGSWKLTGSAKSMFSSCKALTSLDLTMFDTSSVTNMREMFYNCDNLQTLDLSSFSTSNVTETRFMFSDSPKLKTIYASTNFVTTKVTKDLSLRMFDGCTSLKGGNGTAYNANYVDKTYARIDKSGQKGYFTAK